jgi:hypothetical protein
VTAHNKRDTGTLHLVDKEREKTGQGADSITLKTVEEQLFQAHRNHILMGYNPKQESCQVDKLKGELQRLF